ncbi:UvrD-helicase domain-containing protein [Hyalangium versicolor]|uniref:UvrD-helicase domain-containing protein n=1 Tax=Hyalangium versicolor TaxID=2861190 RepID=UPI001CCCA5C7|nr:UvrD-helicase domain-containing protein [Hyalangium versicolor]
MGITQQEQALAEAAQHAAAHDTSPQVRLVAGPGTGKSFAIEERVYWLLKSETPAEAIFVVSFTRAAAIELGARIRRYCEKKGLDNASKVSVTTLHSLALRVLKRAGQLEQYPSDPVVLDRWECKNIFDKEFSHTSKYNPSRCAKIREEHEAFWNTRTWGPPNYIPPDPPISESERSAFNTFNGPRTQTYSCVLPGQIIYQCIEQVAAGTLEPVGLLGIQHLIVDEFQDLNPCDLEFVDHLVEAGVPTFIAGDDDQSIYSFRYASPQGIQTFDTKYPSARTHRLDACFRCTPSILATATTVLSRNLSPQRIPKALRSLYATATPPVTGSVRLWSFSSHKQEANAIASSCQALADAGVLHREIIILLSNRKLQEQALTDAFDAAQIPYSPPREDGYSDSDEGRFALSCLRIVCNKNDFVAYRTLLGILPQVGIATCNKIAENVLLHNLRYPDLFEGTLPANVFGSRETQALSQASAIRSVIGLWIPSAALEDHSDELADLLLTHFGETAHERWLAAIDILPSQSTLKETLTYLQAETDDQQASVLDDIALRLGAEPPSATTSSSRVRMMTAHGAKGLGAQVVFVPGMEESIWPGESRARYPGLVQEAARLLYVAITRARGACILSFAKKRLVFGRMKPQTASRFATQLNGRFLPRQEGLTATEATEIEDCISALQLQPPQAAPAVAQNPKPPNAVPTSAGKTNLAKASPPSLISIASTDTPKQASSMNLKPQIPDQSILTDDLRSQIRNRQVLCIIGAGVSIAATGGNPVASWLGLLHHGLRYCMQVVQPTPPPQWQQNVYNDIETGRETGDTLLLLSAAEKISSKLGAPNGGEYANWLELAMGSLKANSQSLIRAILALGVPVATTNYDGLFEEVSELPAISPRDTRDIERVFRGQQAGVVHLHGWWRHAETVVLGIRSYDQVLANAQGQALLRALASMKGAAQK